MVVVVGFEGFATGGLGALGSTVVEAVTMASVVVRRPARVGVTVASTRVVCVGSALAVLALAGDTLTRTFARHPDNLQEDLLPNWSNSWEM